MLVVGAVRAPVGWRLRVALCREAAIMAARDGGRLLFWSTGEAERVDVWDGRGGEEAGAVATTVAMGGRCGRAMVVGAERSGKVGSVAMPTGMVRRVGGGGGRLAEVAGRIWAGVMCTCRVCVG